jgi:hypothetical protein
MMAQLEGVAGKGSSPSFACCATKTHCENPTQQKQPSNSSIKTRDESSFPSSRAMAMRITLKKRQEAQKIVI